MAGNHRPAFIEQRSVPPVKDRRGARKVLLAQAGLELAGVERDLASSRRTGGEAFIKKVQGDEAYSKILCNLATYTGIGADVLRSCLEALLGVCWTHAQKCTGGAEGKVAELEEKVRNLQSQLNKCNASAMREISNLRARGIVAGIAVDDSDDLEFHDALQYVDEATRQLVIAIVNDKVGQVNNGSPLESVMEGLSAESPSSTTQHRGSKVSPRRRALSFNGEVAADVSDSEDPEEDEKEEEIAALLARVEQAERRAERAEVRMETVARQNEKRKTEGLEESCKQVQAPSAHCEVQTEISSSAVGHDPQQWMGILGLEKPQVPLASQRHSSAAAVSSVAVQTDLASKEIKAMFAERHRLEAAATELKTKIRGLLEEGQRRGIDLTDMMDTVGLKPLLAVKQVFERLYDDALARLQRAAEQPLIKAQEAARKEAAHAAASAAAEAALNRRGLPITFDPEAPDPRLERAAAPRPAPQAPPPPAPPVHVGGPAFMRREPRKVSLAVLPPLGQQRFVAGMVSEARQGLPQREFGNRATAVENGMSQQTEETPEASVVADFLRSRRAVREPGERKEVPNLSPGASAMSSAGVDKPRRGMNVSFSLPALAA